MFATLENINKPGLPGRGCREGFSLTELTVAVALFALMAGGLVYSLMRAKSLSWTSRERALAMEAAQSVMERVRGAAFDQAFSLYNANPLDDPPGVLAPGSDFAVPGLTVQLGDPDGFVGEVLFPGDGLTLLENVQDRDWGMPRDLDLDTQIEAVGYSADYQVLPVRVRVSWRGPAGDQQVELTSVLVEG